MKKRLIGLGLALTMAASLAGCGSTSGSASQSAAPAAESAQASAGESTSSEGSRVIHVATIWSEDEEGSKYMKELTEEYRKDHPEVSIEFEVVAQDSMDQHLAVLASSDSLPDVMIMSSAKQIRDYSASGQLLNVGEKLKEAGITSLDDNTIEGVKGLQGTDELYVLPTENNIEGIFYNKKIFDEYGLTVPETYDDLMNICQTLKDNGVQPFVSAGAEKWPLSRLFGAYTTQVGGVDVLRQANYGEISWSDPAILDGFQFLLDMGNNGYLGNGVTTIDMDTQNSMFLNGQAAMLYNGSWFVQNLNSDANTLGEDVGFFAFPTVEGGKGTGNNYVVSYGVTWAFSAKAWDDAFAGWFEYVFSHYGDEAMNSGGAITPYALNEEHETPYYTQMILDAMEKGGEVAVWPEFYVGGEIQTAIYEQAQNLAIGATTPDAAAKAIDEAFAANN